MIKEIFYDVLEGYRLAMTEGYSHHPLANTIRHELPDSLRGKASITDAYIVEGSAGRGNWAEIPWIGVFDKEITKSAASGFYIVYLFDAEMGGVHLSLNQGWIQYEERYKGTPGSAKKEIRKAARKLKSCIKSTLTDFSFEEIDLHASNTLGKAYQLSHICGKFYDKNALPSDEEIVDDLRNMIGVYRELKGTVGTDIFNLDAALDALSEVGIQEIEIDTSDVAKIRQTELRLGAVAPVEKKMRTATPMIFDEAKSIREQRQHKRVGDAAERLVCESEVNRLSQCGKDDLAVKVKIVSEDMSLGYDILSYEEDGSEKYIEVKGTQFSDSQVFFLTSNELEKSKTLPNYYLYIVHNVDAPGCRIEYVRLPDFSSDLFFLEPKQYMVKYQPSE